MKPKTSWIARGFWIISIFIVVSFVHTMLVQFSGNADETVLKALSVVGIIFAVSTMAYTGILLGASKGITLWRSGAVPVIFVVSALVTGHFAIMIGLILFGDGAAVAETLRPMAAEAAGLVVLEVLAILFFLQAAWKHPDPRESVERLLRNRMFLFWYVLAGLLTPLVLMLVMYRGMTDSTAIAVVGALLGLIGGLVLRQGVLMFGALPTLNVGGFEFRRVSKPKETKAPIGMLPPQ
jgi:formate-dependent nitrite reductase membrane component NrfD